MPSIEICPPCAEEIEADLPSGAVAEFLHECELLEKGPDEPRREGPRQGDIRVLLFGWGEDAGCALFGVVNEAGTDVLLFVKIVVGMKEGLQPGDYAQARARFAQCKRGPH
jgi:hypothetical protein